MSINRRMAKQMMVCPFYGILLSNIKEQNTDRPNKMKESKNHAEGTKLNIKEYVLQDPIYMKGKGKIIVTESRQMNITDRI